MELKEPKFMQEIHKIRQELSTMPPSEYKKHLEETKKRYAERLGHLYVDLPVVKTKQKSTTLLKV